MGCSASKEEDLPLVSLCRRRRDLIRAASDRRYDLAAAHASYFRALDRVGDALHRFVLEDLTAVSSPPSSPVLTLPPSKSKSDDSFGNGSGVNEDSRHLSSLTSSISLSSSSSGSEFSHHHHHHHHDDPDPDPDPHGSAPGSDDRFHYPAHHPSPPPRQFSSFVNPGYYYQDPINDPYGYRNPQLNPNFYPDPISSAQFPSFPSTNFYYMRKAATTPSTFYMDPNAGSFGFDYSNYYYDDFNPTIRDERGNADEPAAEKPPPPPPPPPEPVASGWDFFNVFDTYEQFLMNRDGRLGAESGSRSGSFSSPDSSEIREKEGIPDLEEETDLESFREGEKKKEVGGFDGGSLKAAHLDGLAEEKWETVLNEKGSKEEMIGRKKGVSFEGEGSIKTDENGLGSSMSSSLVTEESGLSNGIEMHVHGVKDVVEAVEEIKQQFKSAAGCGDEVAKLLEVGKRRYRPRRTLLRVIFSRVLDYMALSASTSLGHLSSDVHHPETNPRTVTELMGTDYINVKSNDLSETLDRLYVWEKKLCKEVKDEEKLRVIYEKECLRLKALDDGGAESDKIDSTRASIRNLLSELSISIKSVDSISNRIHKLRDEELRPQLIELIQGLMTMWKSMLACHGKQFQAIAESKTHNLMARSRNQRNSVAKATMELEIELLNWSFCFRNWISTQKAYVEALNGWLMKWLIEEQEETPDGVMPFSPGRMGAPTIFIISNDWHHAIESISEVGVTTAMQIFTENVHKLWKTQDEEQRQKLKAEYLSRDFYRRLRSLQKQNGPVDLFPDKRAMPLSSGATSHDDHIMISLDSMKKRLDEEKAKHQEIIKHVQEAAASSLQSGLVPVFEALSNYTTDTVKAYEQLRNPRDDDEGT